MRLVASPSCSTANFVKLLLGNWGAFRKELAKWISVEDKQLNKRK